MGAVELASAFTDPQHVPGAVVPVVGERVLASEGFFVVEQQRLMRGVEVDFVERAVAAEVDATRTHERQRAFDVLCELFVLLANWGVGDKLLVPLMNLAQVGEAAAGECPHEVQRGRGTVVGHQQAVWLRSTFAFGEANVVDDVSTE